MKSWIAGLPDRGEASGHQKRILSRSHGARLAAAFMLAVLAAGAAVASDDPSTRFHEGNRLYQEGDYEGAVEAYRSILDSGQRSAALYYNLGNAEFKRGNLGRAALNYERANRLAPSDGDIEANLRLAYSTTADKITPVPRFWLFAVSDAWLSLIPPEWPARLTAFFYLAAMAAWTGRILARGSRTRTLGLRLSLACFLCCAVFGATWWGVQSRASRSDEAIVLASEAVVRSAPSDDPGLKIFEIHEGTKVRVTQQAGEWSEIMLADGKVGWVASEVYEII